jgi:hypothetical protein
MSGLTDGNAQLSCVATASDTSELSVEWKILKDGKSRTLYAEPDSLEMDTQLDGTTLTSKLTMFDLTREDAADYQCVVRNRFGTAYSRKAALVVNVFPTFLKTPQNVTLEPGRNARLECSALGYPAPILRWQKDGGDDFPAARERRMHVMPTDDVFFIVNYRSRFVCKNLLIKCKRDSSEWFRSTDLWVMGPARFHCATLLLCTELLSVLYIGLARIIDTAASMNECELFSEKPSFRQPLQDKTVQAGTTVVLGCVAEGSPVPHVQ